MEMEGELMRPKICITADKLAKAVVLLLITNIILAVATVSMALYTSNTINSLRQAALR